MFTMGTKDTTDTWTREGREGGMNCVGAALAYTH